MPANSSTRLPTRVTSSRPGPTAYDADVIAGLQSSRSESLHRQGDLVLARDDAHAFTLVTSGKGFRLLLRLGGESPTGGYTIRRPRSRTVSSIRSASAVVVLQLTKAGRNATRPAQRVVPT